MKNNLVFVRTRAGGIAPALAIDASVYGAVNGRIARNLNDLASAPSKCIIAEFDSAQAVPIVRRSVKVGSPTILGAIAGLFTGRTGRRWVYWATSEGLRQIAVHGSPERAFAAQ